MAKKKPLTSSPKQLLVLILLGIFGLVLILAVSSEQLYTNNSKAAYLLPTLTPQVKMTSTPGSPPLRTPTPTRKTTPTRTPTPIPTAWPTQRTAECISMYAPVCGADGKTYSNSCFASQNTSTFIDCSGACPCKTVAYFQMKDSKNSIMVFKLTDQILIQKARNAITNNTFPIGKVYRVAVPYNTPWHFAYQPTDFVSNAVELCDGSIDYVETHPNFNAWCPWSGKIIKEIKYP